jgi:Tfp pilus assembly ATPase PilU
MLDEALQLSHDVETAVKDKADSLEFLLDQMPAAQRREVLCDLSLALPFIVSQLRDVDKEVTDFLNY